MRSLKDMPPTPGYAAAVEYSESPTVKRREFLRLGTLAIGGAFVTSRLALARTSAAGQSRLVFVLMRGALDGLAAVPPCGDPEYEALRGELTLSTATRLDGFFGLHPSLSFLQESYAARELIVFHAIASPYRDRSHFDGQDVLENGTAQPHGVQTGWLNRALVSMQSHSKDLGVAMGQNMPLIMRGPASVTSWSSSKLPTVDEDTLERITDLYAADPLLSVRLADALAADAIADMPVSAMQDSNAPAATELTDVAGKDSLLRRAKPVRYTEVVRAAAGFLRREEGPRVAVFDTTGWDTHANEGAAEGQLAGRLAALDSGLSTLKQELGPVWRDTAVVLATEFGRTVATNGTRGTDHGTATVAFLLGGAVQGGRVLADWPGLSARALYQGRDLKPTTDLRSMLKGVLAEHLLVSSGALESSVFPNSAAAKPIKGLFRA